ncbi:MAG TPA: hypothetical protein VHH11_08675 [Gammaproteobacteria bacterium]|jgi:hypothetical protein|nr:hypothetical protein [Gammaproteobacteria bacterium]
MDSVSVGKIDTASRQLDAAIGLFFSGNDLVAVHSLADSAARELADLVRPKAAEAAWHDQVQTALNLDASTYQTVLRRTQDLLTPEQRDPDARNGVDPRQTAALMVQVIMSIGGLGVRPSVPQAVLQLWYFACMLNELPHLHANLRAYILSRFKDLSRRTGHYQLAVGRRVLQEDIERNSRSTAAADSAAGR